MAFSSDGKALETVEGLADGRPDHDASGSEWRTPPLWGLGLVPVVNLHDRLLHDGRARGFAEAILWLAGPRSAKTTGGVITVDGGNATAYVR